MQVRRSRSAWTSIILALASLPLLMAPSAEAGVRPPFIFANAGGPYTISEGTALMLDGSGGCSPFGFCPIAGWDLTGDSVIDVSGFTPTIPFSDLIALDIDALGPHGITLIVGDLSFPPHQATSATTFTVTAPNVPEPATLVLFGAGIAGLAFWRRKQRSGRSMITGVGVC